MPVVYGNPHKVDWKNVTAVIAYAKKLGPGLVVYQAKGRDNYNITHADRYLTEPEYRQHRVIHVT